MMLEIDIRELTLCLKKTRQRYLLGVGLSYAVLIIFLVIIAKFFSDQFIIIFLCAFISIVVGIWIGIPFYMVKFKKEIVLWLCQRLDLSFSSRGFFNLSSFRRHKILPVPLSGQGIEEDSFSGTYSGYNFVIEELMFAGAEYEGKTRFFSYVPRFPENRRWMAIRLEMKRGLLGHTIIVSDSALKASLKEMFVNMKKVNIVSSKFEKHYDVLSTDQVEARFLLDPVVIEKFTHFSNVLNVNDIRISFLENELLIVYKDCFPLIMVPSLFHPIKGDNLSNPIIFSINRFLVELEEVVGIIDTISAILPKYIASREVDKGIA